MIRVADTSKVFKALIATRKDINEFYGEKSWSIRKISRADKDGTPSLTLRTELENIGLSYDDYVIIAYREDDKGKYIEIRPFSQFIS